MKASSISFQTAGLFVLAGMVWGLQMAISNDHAAFPAHAHLNLLGWVSLFLFGIYYHLHPSMDRSRAALIQVCIWIAGTIILAIGVGLVHTGHEVAAMLVFGWLVFRSQREPTSERSTIMPAE